MTQIDIQQQLPLEGIRIIDVTEYVAGPTATLILSGLGAQVIKVERTYLADHRPYRKVTAPRPGVVDQVWNRVPWFNELNRGKLSVPLNLSKPKGIAVFKKLVHVSDVVINNFSPRVMKNFGLDYDHLKEENPGIISVSISGLGASGPWKQWISAGPNIDVLSGVADLTGYPGGGPMRPANANPDLIGGQFGAFATMAALEERAQTGKGQDIDLSMLEATVQFLGEAVVALTSGGSIPTRVGNSAPGVAPSGCYPCHETDTWITISVRSDAEWQIVCELIGHKEYIDDPKFTDSLSRLKNSEELDAVLSEWTSKHNYLKLSEQMTAQGLVVGAVRKPQDLFEDAHLREREFLQTTQETQAIDAVYPRLGWLSSDIPLRTKAPAPLHAEHGQFVLGELLGMPSEEIEELKNTGVTVDIPVNPF